MIFKAYVLMLKLVYPCASKTFKVLSYCAVRMHGRNLCSIVTQCILLIKGLPNS